MPARTKKNGLADFNLNSILVIIAGVVVTWLVNNGLSTAKETKQATVDTKQSVAEIKVALPFIAKSQDRLEGDVKQIKDEQKNLVTKPELDSNHKALQDAIQDVRDDVKDVQTEQSKVREALVKRTNPKP